MKSLIVVKKTGIRLVLYLLLFISAKSSVAQEIFKGVRVSYSITDEQVDFINTHFDFVLTPFLSNQIRESFQESKLFLYRSIQGTWTDFNQFDWNHINSNENMFCHSDSADQSESTRILTIWNSWLMDGRDLVDSLAADAMNHWVNYYAVTASNQVHTYDYDGLFIDSAGHKLGEGAVNGIMPWDYSADTWRDGRYAALSFIKTYISDKKVIFNGLHSGNGADSSLSLTDGGMWEDFVYDINDGSYKGVKKWWDAILCMQNNRDSSYLVLVIKKPGLISDIQARIFSVASYLLISSPNVVLTLSDWSDIPSLQYYPEFEISLGSPLRDFTMREDSLFIREFEHGIALVNPGSSLSKTFQLEKDYYKIVPVGGGLISSAGSYDGHLSYELVSGEIEIPPVSGMILKDSAESGVSNDHVEGMSFKLMQNYPNPFNPVTNISYKTDKSCKVRLAVLNVKGQIVETLIDGNVDKGIHTVQWKPDNVSSGVYFYMISAGGYKDIKKCLLVR
ncbi:hypothetical protein DRQ07_04655 [candidate division KSB1 bacterium]|nr:MAG: hypothetical protein DRQ07_04655 [candidate division KSB1 bacterium]